MSGRPLFVEPLQMKLERAFPDPEQVRALTAQHLSNEAAAVSGSAHDLLDRNMILNHLDHGYAATIHKAQGVTVDRTHLLASPGLDRHATYVALSRHRQSVDLHYGRDDFADQRRLGRVLSRERAKDMASDYECDIRRDVATEQPVPARSMFAGFKPTPTVALEQTVTADLSDLLAACALQYPWSVVRLARKRNYGTAN
jgi:hypothetical protein